MVGSGGTSSEEVEAEKWGHMGGEVDLLWGHWGAKAESEGTGPGVLVGRGEGCGARFWRAEFALRHQEVKGRVRGTGSHVSVESEGIWHSSGQGQRAQIWMQSRGQGWGSGVKAKDQGAAFA